MLAIKPLSLSQANDAVEKWHRHHKPVSGMRFALGAVSVPSGALVGVCIVGRPKARALDQWSTAEVVRVATDGTFNACSFLYARATKVCKEMGFRRLITYTLDGIERGESLKALKQLGWCCDGVVRKNGKGWNSRPNRRTDQPTGAKVRWSVVFERSDRVFGRIDARESVMALMDM